MKNEYVHVTIEGIKADKKTLNGNVYSKELLEKNIKKLQDKIEDKGVVALASTADFGFDCVVGWVKSICLDQENRIACSFAMPEKVCAVAAKDLIKLLEIGKVGIYMASVGIIDDEGNVLEEGFKIHHFYFGDKKKAIDK